MPADLNFEDVYESRRKQLTEVLTKDLSGALAAANMFNEITDRISILRLIGFAYPDRLVRPSETAAAFQERLIHELGSKLLVEHTTKLLEKLDQLDVRPDNFPGLTNVRATCDQIRLEIDTRVSGKLDANTGAPAKYMVEFEYGIRPYEECSQEELSDRTELWNELMDWADRKRFEDQPVFCIEAAGGLGKSMLAWSWFQAYYRLHKSDGKYDAYVWWSFYGHDAGFENFVNWALLNLGAADNTQKRDPLLDRIRRLNDILDAGGVVMVLDGVERLAVAYLDPQEREAINSIGTSGRQSSYRASRQYTDNDIADEDVGEFFGSLRGAKRSRILTTSRVAPGPFIKRSMKQERGVLLRQLLPLELDFCVHMWRQINPNEVDWDRVRDLCENVGRNTLLIRVLASAVSVTAGGLLANWPTDDASKELLTTAPVNKARSRLLKYALGRISRAARLVLKTLCAFPSPMKRELALRLVGDQELLHTSGEPEAMFVELSSWALIGVVKNDGIVSAYDIHPIVRDHVRLSEVYREPKDLAILDNIFQAVPDAGASQVRDVQDLYWAIAQFERALANGLYLNAWEVFRDRLVIPLQFLGADDYIVGLLRFLFADHRFLGLPLLGGDRAAQAEILRLVATSAVRLNVDIDTDRLWRWCLALQFLTQDVGSCIRALDSRIALSVYSGRIAECQQDIVLALSLAKDYNFPTMRYSLYCFLGISLAFQGDQARSMKAFERAEESLSALQESDQATSRRWVLQGQAEALVWLGDAQGARDAVKRMEAEGSSHEVSWGQRAWEEWTAGAADLMIGDDLESAIKHINSAANLSEQRHYFLVRLLCLALRVGWALERGQLEQVKQDINSINESDPYKRCLPAQILANLFRAKAAKKESRSVELIQFAQEAYRLTLEFRVYRAGIAKARDLLPSNLRSSHPDVLAEPYPAVVAVLDREELPPVAAENTAKWWASHSGISGRSRELVEHSTDKVAERISQILPELVSAASDAVRNWWAQVEAEYTSRDQLLILEVVQAGCLPVEHIVQMENAEPRRLAPVVEYCDQLRTLGVLSECKVNSSRVFKELSIEERLVWLESLGTKTRYAGLVDYQSNPGVVFDRVQFDRALGILMADDYGAFIERLRGECCPDEDLISNAWWSVLIKLLPPRDVLYFGEEIVSLQITVAEFLDGLEIDNPRSCRARLATLHSESLAASQIACVTNTAGWSVEQVLVRLEQVKSKIDWSNTTGSAHRWWQAFEKENSDRMPLVLRLAEELALRKATITEFFLAYVYSNTDHIQANLHYLDYVRIKKEVEREKKDASARINNEFPGTRVTTTDRFSRIGHLNLSRAVTNTAGWSVEQVLLRLEEVKSKLDWSNTTGSAHKWWQALEKENSPRMPSVLRLAEELALRKATITEFFLAWIYSNTDDIQANLNYLDYQRLKKQEERRKSNQAAKA